MGTSAARKLDPPPAPDPEVRTAESFLEEIEQILNSGTLRGAREVAEQGLALYPDHSELRQAFHALRPYERARVVPGHKISDPSASYEWIKKNSGRYPGQWVAISNGELVTVADSLDQILQTVRDWDPRKLLLHHFLA
ncbi:MAG: hypothetical protein WAM82_08370 [Thermoanaerobaculia bacterium]